MTWIRFDAPFGKGNETGDIRFEIYGPVLTGEFDRIYYSRDDIDTHGLRIYKNGEFIGSIGLYDAYEIALGIIRVLEPYVHQNGEQ